MNPQTPNNNQSQDEYLDPLGIGTKSDEELKELFLKIFGPVEQAKDKQQDTTSPQNREEYLDPLGIATKSDEELRNLFLLIFGSVNGQPEEKSDPTPSPISASYRPQAPTPSSLFANLTAIYNKRIQNQADDSHLIKKQQEVEKQICDVLHLGELEHVTTIDALSLQRDEFFSEKINLEKLLSSDNSKPLLEHMFANAPIDMQNAFKKLQEALVSKNKQAVSDAGHELNNLILKHQGASITHIEPVKEAFLLAGARLHTLLVSETSTTDELQKAYVARNHAQIAYMSMENEFLELENEFYKDLAKQAGLTITKGTPQQGATLSS